jgi:hypothetical protein
MRRNSPHWEIPLAEWLDAIHHTAGVRLASGETADHREWIGYRPAPEGIVQFHHRADRAYDAEVFFPDLTAWRRALYWIDVHEAGNGLVIFETWSENVQELEDPLSVAAVALANRLQAVLDPEDESPYE